MRKYTVTLTEEEVDEIKAIAKKGTHRSQKVLNSLILLNCDEGEFCIGHSLNKEITSVLDVSMKKIDRVKRRFVEDGLSIALNGRKGNRIYKRKADGDFEAHLVALSCSKPPGGFAKWSLRLLADKVVELKYIDNVSYETIRRVLKKTNLNLGKQRDG